MKDKLEKELSKILEQTCGLTCPNGAEGEKPATDAISTLIESHTKEYISKTFEEILPKEVEMDFGNDEIRWTDRKGVGAEWMEFAQRKGYNQALSDIRENLAKKK